MVERYAALLHHFLDMDVAQRVGRIPADADHDDFGREKHSFDVEHSGSVFGVAPYLIVLRRFVIATEPVSFGST